MEQRQWATQGDREVSKEELPNERHTHWGDHPSSEAIGGYFGVAWYEYFQDNKTNEIYKVKCYDGVYRSKEAYKRAQ